MVGHLSRRRTIAFRLVAAAGFGSLTAVGMFCWVAVVLVHHELSRTLDAGLRQRAVVVAQLAVSAPALLSDPNALDTSLSGRQIAVEVIDPHGRIVGRSATLGASLLPIDRLAHAAIDHGRTGYEDIRVGDRPFRMYAGPIAAAGPAAGGAVLVATGMGDIGATVAHLRTALIVAGLLVALAATVAAAGLIRGALRPLRRLVASAAEIERTADPSRRLPASRADDELGQLGGVLNRMLASLERARAGERRFLADASHELRTPVTTLIGNIDYLRRHAREAGPDPEVLEDLGRDAARLARLVDDLLALERVGGTGAETELRPIQLDQLITATVAELGRGGDRVRSGPLPAVTVHGDQDALARALSNLIENALVHGPEGGRVTLTLARANHGARARISVSDEGAGPAPDERERLFERFWRSPEASGRPGSGLGLAIVAAIAERHRGSVTVDGSTFTLELPAG